MAVVAPDIARGLGQHTADLTPEHLQFFLKASN
jgi:hypothetical protein